VSAIEIARVGLPEYETLLRRTVCEALKGDAEFLRSLEIKPLIATSAEEADLIAQTKGLLVVRGFLSLDGLVGRMLEFTMEYGLTDSQDQEIADQLALQCVACITILKANKAQESLRYSVKQQPYEYENED